MEGREITCIVCPLGCQMEIIEDPEAKGYIVNGNACVRGEQYAIKEFTNPTRVVTTTVKLKNSRISRLPVKTDIPVPKEMVLACMKELDSAEAEAPVRAGDTIIENILDTGANVISTRSI